jgi:hypothetical protein
MAFYRASLLKSRGQKNAVSEPLYHFFSSYTKWKTNLYPFKNLLKNKQKGTQKALSAGSALRTLSRALFDIGENMLDDTLLPV